MGACTMGPWEGGPVVPGQASHGPLGCLQRAPGGGGSTGPNYNGHFLLSTRRIRINIYVGSDVVFGSILGPSWGHDGVMLEPFSAQVGPATVFEPSLLRKSDLSRNNTFSYGCFLAEDGGPRRPKIAPRRVQDRLGSLLFHLICCFVF